MPDGIEEKSARTFEPATKSRIQGSVHLWSELITTPWVGCRHHKEFFGWKVSLTARHARSHEYMGSIVIIGDAHMGFHVELPKIVRHLINSFDSANRDLPDQSLNLMENLT